MRFTPGLDDLATKFPLLLGEWHPQNNGEKTPSDFSAGSHTKVWWLCAKGHEWLTSIEARTRLAGPTSCPYCSGRQVIPGQNDLGTVAPSLASQFSAKNKVSVSAVNPTSKTNYIWVCPQGHEWTGTAKSRTAGRDCPICDGKVLTSGENDLATKLPELAEYWDFEKNKQKPSDVSASARNSFQWTCSKGHEWRSTIYTLVKNPTCPRCRNADGRPKAQRIGSSFPSLEKEWNSVKNFGLTFSSMGISDVKKYWWICDKGHVWKTSVAHRANDRQCPACVSKGYNQTKPGLFYFIQHSGKHSRKVGITNISTRTKRIDGWAERGWKIIKVVESENGSAIADLETEMFRWIRNDLGLPRYLEQRDMDGMGGWSETFSDDDEPSNIEVIAKIDKVWAEVQEKHTS
jgi:hypothetical protein